MPVHPSPDPVRDIDFALRELTPGTRVAYHFGDAAPVRGTVAGEPYPSDDGAVTYVPLRIRGAERGGYPVHRLEVIG
jgi:hypothetical protein